MKLLLVVIFTTMSQACFADDAGIIIEKLLTADAEMENRLVNEEVVVSQLSKSGVFKKKPSEHEDYSDYYIPQKPVYVLGAKLISFEHEYMLKYIGCCVNPGTAVVLQPTGNTTAIKSFAKKNKCKFKEGDQIFHVPESALKGLSVEERKSLIEVSCKYDSLSK